MTDQETIRRVLAEAMKPTSADIISARQVVLEAVRNRGGDVDAMVVTLVRDYLGIEPPGRLYSLPTFEETDLDRDAPRRALLHRASPCILRDSS